MTKMTIKTTLDLTVFGDYEEEVQRYLSGIDEEFREMAYDAMVEARNTVETLFAAKPVLHPNFSLSYAFEGDSGVEDQAQLAYFRMMDDVLQVISIHPDHVIVIS